MVFSSVLTIWSKWATCFWRKQTRSMHYFILHNDSSCWNTFKCRSYGKSNHKLCCLAWSRLVTWIKFKGDPICEVSKRGSIWENLYLNIWCMPITGYMYILEILSGKKQIFGICWQFSIYTTLPLSAKVLKSSCNWFVRFQSWNSSWHVRPPIDMSHNISIISCPP